MATRKVSTVRAAIVRSGALRFAHSRSIGSRLGEYGGRQTSSARRASDVSRTPRDLVRREVRALCYRGG